MRARGSIIFMVMVILLFSFSGCSSGAGTDVQPTATAVAKPTFKSEVVNPKDPVVIADITLPKLDAASAMKWGEIVVEGKINGRKELKISYDKNGESKTEYATCFFIVISKVYSTNDDVKVKEKASIPVIIPYGSRNWSDQFVNIVNDESYIFFMTKLPTDKDPIGYDKVASYYVADPGQLVIWKTASGYDAPAWMSADGAARVTIPEADIATAMSDVIAKK